MSTRRHFLRGLGASIAVPLLPSLAPGAFAAASAGRPGLTPSGMPLRTAFFFFPNGSIPQKWWPDQEGADFAFSPSLAPLEPLRRHVQILGGLENRNGEGGPDGAGDHARGVGTFLTGVRLRKSATDLRAGVSIDQIMARHLAAETRLPSLELSCDAVRKSGACDSGYSCAYQFNLSWSGPSSPVAPEANPRQLFERLFGSGTPEERAAAFLRRQARRKSVLDFVMEDARAMQRRLDARDNEKLDQYLTGLREIEQRLDRAETFGPPPDPGVPAPAGVPADYGEHIALMADLLVMAFRTDTTRVATFLLAHDGSNRAFPQIGVPEGHHDISHHQNKPELMDKVAQIDRWYAAQFAAFLTKMEGAKDADGTSLLHNSMIVFGGGNGDPNRHNHDNLPFVLAGHGGGTLQPGAYRRLGAVPAMNLMLSLADRMGVPELERFGDSTGRLAAI